jgi:hypothetical protein
MLSVRQQRALDEFTRMGADIDGWFGPDTNQPEAQRPYDANTRPLPFLSKAITLYG